MRCFSRPNLASLDAIVVEEPWKLPPLKFPDGTPKPEIQKAWKDTNLRHAFLTGFEGMTETGFVDAAAKNRPVKMWCFFVDYDCPLTVEQMASMKASPGGSHPPAWVYRSVRGKMRLVWDFEAPVGIANDKQAKAFIDQLTAKLMLSSWLPSLDHNCLKVYQCFEVGSDWQQLSEYKIPAATLSLWLMEASRGISLLGPEDRRVDIPIDVVAEQVQKEFPGRWEGEFTLGARGIRFWDPIADNPTAAVVCADGMMCFTGDKPFVKWGDIFFRSKFVEAWESKKADTVVRRTLWDEHNFWLHQDDGYWEKYDTASMSRWLRVQGFSAKAGPGGSEIDRALSKVQMDQRIRAALPFIHQPHGPKDYQGERVLNISKIKVLAPAGAGIFPVNDFGAAVKTFPWIWSFLSQFLELVKNQNIQLEYLLQWMKYTYERALEQRPGQGQALVLAGKEGDGKTFFATVILGKMLGGTGDQADYIIRGSQWSNQLAKWPIALIDDSQGSADHGAHAQFSALVKKLVANRMLSYNGKYESTGTVEWLGRVVILCNDDAESLRLLPTMDISVARKISLLKTSSRGFVFETDEENVRRVNEELPYFCRFLLGMEVNEVFKDLEKPRFFLKPFHHPELLSYSSRGSKSYTVFETIHAFLETYRIQKPEAKFWEGTATQLFQCISADLVGNQKATLSNLNPYSLGIALGQMRAKGMPVVAQDDQSISRWRIPTDLRWSNEFLIKGGYSVSDFLKTKAENGDEDGRAEPGTDRNSEHDTVRDDSQGKETPGA